MNVLLLGVTPSPLRPIVEKTNCTALELGETISVDFLRMRSVDFVVSYRYQHIISKDIIEYLKGQIINLHISLLPWNRGADPNLWSFLEDTPKGVSIHFIDPGIDTGDIIAQRSVGFDVEQETLETSYMKLNETIIRLFFDSWPLIKEGRIVSKRQPPGGTYHRTADKERYHPLLKEKGWATPVKELIGRALPGGKDINQ
jgi:methionyl-tRNA formyltransferase